MAEKKQSREDEAYQEELAAQPAPDPTPEVPMAAGQRPAPEAPPQRGLIPEDGGALGVVGRGLNAGADAINNHIDRNVNAAKMVKDSKALQFADRWANPINMPVVAATGKTIPEWTAEASKDPGAFAHDAGKAALEGGTGWGLAKSAADLWNGKPATPVAPAAPGAPPGAPVTGGDGAPMGPSYPPVRNVGAVNAPTVDPKYIKWMQELNKDERDAAGREGDATRELGQASADQQMSVAAGHQVVSDERDAQGAQMQERADQRAAQAAQMRARIDATSAEVAARSKEDPDQWYKNQGAAKTAGWGIAAFLGGFGKGENEVLKMVRDHVHNNIASQRQDYEHDRDRVNDMNNLYAQAYRATGDHDAAYDQAAQWQLDAVKEKALAMAASTGSNVEIAKAKVLAEGIDREKAQIGQRGVKQDAAWHKYVPAHQEGGPGAGFRPDWATQEKITKALEAARVPAARGAYHQFQTLLKDPETHPSPSQVRALQLAMATGSTDNVHRVMAFMSPKQRMLINSAWQGAATEVGEEGMRASPQVAAAFAKNVGTGSIQDLQNGSEIMRNETEARYRNAARGFDPNEVMFHESPFAGGATPQDLRKPQPAARPPGFQEAK